jgi:hypothetical protein
MLLLCFLPISMPLLASPTSSFVACLVPLWCPLLRTCVRVDLLSVALAWAPAVCAADVPSVSPRCISTRRSMQPRGVRHWCPPMMSTVNIFGGCQADVSATPSLCHQALFLPHARGFIRCRVAPVRHPASVSIFIHALHDVPDQPY